MSEAQTPWSAAFAADLHVQARDPRGVRRAVQLVELCARRTRLLYLLGDVFDVWTSQALLELTELQPLYAALRRAADDGLEIHFVPGNRDFNLTRATGERLGIQVGGDWLRVELDGLQMRLSHGDEYLRNDRAYQQFKRVIRSAPARMLARHLPRRMALAAARRLRSYSDQVVPRKDELRLAIVPAAVEERLDEGFDLALCGHVHRAQTLAFPGDRRLLVLPAFLEETRFAVLEGGQVRLCDLDEQLGDFPAPATVACSSPPGR